MVLGAVVASVDQRDAKVDQFVELAVQRAPHAGVERQKVLKHLRAVGQRFLRVARLAAKCLLVDFLHFGGADSGLIKLMRAIESSSRKVDPTS